MAGVLSMKKIDRVGIHSRFSVGLLCLLLALPALSQTKFRDPLDTPAEIRSAVTRRPLMAVTFAGERLVAVGSRGLIVGSDDRGKTWTQASVPVQSDLLAVHFPTSNEGWAVGHGGVVLHSVDAGRTWSKQLDGRKAGIAFKAFYSQAGAGTESELAQLEQNYQAGPVLPFLDVWFEDSQHGFVVGSFGMIAATNDGGNTWEPWLHRIDNRQYLNLNAIRGIGNDLYIVGERGQIYRLDRARGRFTVTDTGYLGSFFGIAGNSDALIAYGLRGTTYRSRRGGRAGASHWEPVAMPNEHTITAGSVLAENSYFVLVNAAGQLLLGDGAGKRFHLLKAKNPMRMTGVASLDGRAVVVSGLDGIGTEMFDDSGAIRP